VASIPACHAGDPGSIPGLGAFLHICNICFLQLCLCKDDVAERLRRQPAKLMGIARQGSNPCVVVLKVLLICVLKSVVSADKCQSNFLPRSLVG
jgi:hypothetical protein